MQSLSGTGSLRVGAAFIKAWLPGKTVYLSNPTWGNHRNIFADAGLEWKYYSYFDPASIGLDFAGMKADLEAAPDGSVVVLHGMPLASFGAHLNTVSFGAGMICCFVLLGCAHNPTGIDPTKEQWKEISDLCTKKSHIPFFDVAYQGFATGSLEEDAWAPRFFVEQGHEIMVSQSYSKNLGLYGERVGAINVVCSDKETADKCAAWNLFGLLSAQLLPSILSFCWPDTRLCAVDKSSRICYFQFMHAWQFNTVRVYCIYEHRKGQDTVPKPATARKQAHMSAYYYIFVYFRRLGAGYLLATGHSMCTQVYTNVAYRVGIAIPRRPL